MDHAGNLSAYQELGHGCVGVRGPPPPPRRYYIAILIELNECVSFLQWGGQTQKEVNHTPVVCTALDNIECAGPREFLRGKVPCIK